MSDDGDLTRSPVEQHLAAEHDDGSSEEDQEDAQRGTPGAVLRARMRALKGSTAPVELEVADGDDWMEMLRKTVSPVKRDRQLLRELNEPSPLRNDNLIDLDKNDDVDFRKSSVWKKSTAGKDVLAAAGAQSNLDKNRGFATSIDLMNSLFEKPKPATQDPHASTKGFVKVGTYIHP